MATTYNAGVVTAYGAAVRGGYTGTYEEFCRQQAGYAQSAAAVEQAKEDVQELVDGIPEDYTQLSEDVDTLKEDFTQEFVGFRLVANSYVKKDGAIATFSNWSRTDYIPIPDDGYLQVFNVPNAAEYNCFYDSSKGFVSAFSLTSGANKIKAPNNAAYYILSAQSARISQYKINSTITNILQNDFASERINGDVARNYSREKWLWEIGSISSSGGNVSTSNTLRTKNYLPISMIYAVDMNNIVQVHLYDSSKTFIRRYYQAELQKVATKDYFVTKHSEVKYIRLVFADSNAPYSDVTASANAKIYTTNDADSAIKNYSYLLNLDSGNSELWNEGGLDSNGAPFYRANALRTTRFFELANTGMVFDDDFSEIKVCLYDENKTHLQRIEHYPSRYIDSTFLIAAGASLTSAKYFKIEIQKSGITSFSNPKVLVFTNDKTTSNNIISLNVKNKNAIDVLKIQRDTGETTKDAELRLLFFSDVHAEAYRMKRTIDLLNDWGSDYFDIALNGGDSVYSNGTDENLDWYNEEISKCKIPVLNTVGNHDAWTTDSVLGDRKDAYNLVIAPIKSNIPTIVQPTGASTDGLNYYYYDVNNIRIIVLDYMFWDLAQNEWLTSVLASAYTSEKAVICVSHSQFSAEYEQPIECKWNLKAEFSNRSHLDIQAAESVKQFIDMGGKFICWLTGHLHGDKLMRLISEYGNQIVLSVPAFVNRASTLHKSTDVTAYNYDCLTYIAVDTYYKCVKAYRIGANINVQGVGYHGVSFNYETGELNYCW